MTIFPQRSWFWMQPPSDLHGSGHTARVMVWATVLTHESDWFEPVVWAAACHDLQREDDGDDPDHGFRAGQWVRHELPRQLSQPLDGLELIARACDWHVCPDREAGWDHRRIAATSATGWNVETFLGDMPTTDNAPRDAKAMYDYRGEFEVHITVSTPGEDTLGRFRQWCSARGLKCVRIVLARGMHTEQPMATWRTRDASLSQIVTEANARATEMDRVGFAVLRVKIEAALTNDDVPSTDADAVFHFAENYFEHHVKLLRATTEPCEALVQTCAKHGAHLSRNAFREVADEREERFVTLRSYGVGRMTSESQLQQLRASLVELGEQIVACESEYCVYDTNLELDAGWLRQRA